MGHRFYAIQTTSGHENKVRSLIQRRIDADGDGQIHPPAEPPVGLEVRGPVVMDLPVHPGCVAVEDLHAVGADDAVRRAFEQDEVRHLVVVATAEIVVGLADQVAQFHLHGFLVLREHDREPHAAGQEAARVQICHAGADLPPARQFTADPLEVADHGQIGRAHV